MARLTKTQRSAAARKGWRNRRRNPYELQAHSYAPSYRHTEHLPNIELYGPHRSYGGQVTPAFVKFSSGDAYSLAELDEFIAQLRKVRPQLTQLNRQTPEGY